MKKILKLFISFTMIFLLGINVKVNAEQLRIYDNASLLSSDEEQTLEEKIASITNKYNMDVVIVTTNDTEGKSDESYAQYFYENNRVIHDSDKSGILLLIDMKERYLYIDTQGKCIQYFTDSRLNKIEDDIYNDLGNGKYYKAAETFLKDVDTYMEAGIESNQYNYDEKEVLKDKRIKALLIALASAVIIPGIVCLIIKRGYERPKSESVRVYINENSLNFLAKKDEFVTSHLSKTKIQKNNDSGGSHSGRSTIHTSSSGEKHGGSGRKF